MLNAPPAAQGQAGAPAQPQLELSGSRQMFDWLAEQGISLAFTTYQAAKVFFIGLQPDRKLSVFERTLNRCMGMCLAGDSLYISTLFQLWRFENALDPGQLHDGYDRLYLPQVGWITGDLDIHDIAVDSLGRVVFVNTLFSCLAAVSESHSFVPLWKPPFISKLAAEDRCHMNGLAMDHGGPRYVTCVSESDVADGWRDFRIDGGVVVDVAQNQVAVRGLSMPHSPRMHGGKLWLHNSGTGYFGFADPVQGKFEPVAFCPGYLRGLDFVGDFAVMGISRPRGDKTFAGLPLDENLKQHKAEARCGIQVVDLRTGDVVHWMRMEGVVQELYDVVVLPKVRRPMAIGFVSDEIRRVIRVGSPV
ncbi:MAG: TIGR03032 family protein [SAR324 cluster bacterium]